MVTINIEKRHLYLLTAVMVFLVGVGLVFGGAEGDTPSGASHSLDQIQGYFSGDDHLDDSLGKLQERVTGTCPAGSSIRAISSTGTVTCETDDVGASCSWKSYNGYFSSGHAITEGATGACYWPSSATTWEWGFLGTWLTGQASEGNTLLMCCRGGLCQTSTQMVYYYTCK